jgi:hypothetical protein
VLVDNCGFRCTPENIYTKWLDRRYNITGRFQNSWWKQDPVEHGQYLAPGDGDLTWVECLYQNIAGSAIQLRLATVDNTSTPPEQSPYWNTERTITLDRVVMLECSIKSGRGAFSFSPKSPGPNTDVVMTGCFIQTKNQTNVDGERRDPGVRVQRASEREASRADHADRRHVHHREQRRRARRGHAARRHPRLQRERDDSTLAREHGAGQVGELPLDPDRAGLPPMSASLVFWVLVLLWLVLGSPWPPSAEMRSTSAWRGSAPSLILFALIFLLGWRVFGWPIQG